MNFERGCIILLFFASLAIFAWKHTRAALPDASDWDSPTGAGTDIASAPEPIDFGPVNPEAIVGLSHTEMDPGSPAGPWWYVVNVPTSRPAMPVAPNVVL